MRTYITQCKSKAVWSIFPYAVIIRLELYIMIHRRLNNNNNHLFTPRVYIRQFFRAGAWRGSSLDQSGAGWHIRRATGVYKKKTIFITHSFSLFSTTGWLIHMLCKLLCFRRFLITIWTVMSPIMALISPRVPPLVKIILLTTDLMQWYQPNWIQWFQST